MSKPRILVLLGPAITCLLAAMSSVCLAQQPRQVTVAQPWARATPAGVNMGAAYLTISAPDGGSDTLLSVSSPQVSQIEMHSHGGSGTGGGMQRMNEVKIPEGAQFVFKPGGFHLMLMGLKAPLVEGKQLPLRLEFSRSGRVDVSAQILPAHSLGLNDHGHSHKMKDPSGR